MGNTQAKQIKGWKMISEGNKNLPGRPCLVRETSGVMGQMYQVQLTTKQTMDWHMERYRNRKASRSGHLVDVYDAEVRDEELFECMDNYKLGKVVTENIPIRLKTQHHLSTHQAAYILEGALEGYQQLQQLQASNFLVNDNMMGINDVGKVKVWKNENFALNQLSHKNVHLNNERDMIYEIVHCVNTHTHAQNKELEGIAGMDGLENFTAAISKYGSYLDRHNRQAIGRSLLSSDPANPIWNTVPSIGRQIQEIPVTNTLENNHQQHAPLMSKPPQPINRIPVMPRKPAATIHINTKGMKNQPKQSQLEQNSSQVTKSMVRSKSPLNQSMALPIQSRAMQDSIRSKNTGTFWQKMPNNTINSIQTQERKSLYKTDNKPTITIAKPPTTVSTTNTVNFNHRPHSISFPSVINPTKSTNIPNPPLKIANNPPAQLTQSNSHQVVVNFSGQTRTIQFHAQNDRKSENRASFSKSPKNYSFQNKVNHIKMNYINQRDQIKEHDEFKPSSKRQFISKTTQLSIRPKNKKRYDEEVFDEYKNRSLTGIEKQYKSNFLESKNSIQPSLNSLEKDRESYRNPKSFDHQTDRSLYEISNSLYPARTRNQSNEKIEIVSGKPYSPQPTDYMSNSQSKKVEYEPYSSGNNSYKFSLSNENQQNQKYGNYSYEETARFGKNTATDQHTDFKALYAQFKPLEHEKYSEGISKYLSGNMNRAQEQEKNYQLLSPERSPARSPERSPQRLPEERLAFAHFSQEQRNQEQEQQQEEEQDISAQKTAPNLNEIEDEESHRAGYSSNNVNMFMDEEEDQLYYEDSSEQREEETYAQYTYVDN